MAEADEGKSASKKVGLQVQKKLLGKMATKKTVKAVIDDDTYLLIDELTGLVGDLKGQKESDKYIKDLIKVTVKVGLLMKNEQFNKDELGISLKFQRKLHTLCMTFISFYEVPFSHDSSFLAKNVKEAGDFIHALTQRHLTEKSQKRIDHVFGFFTTDMFEALFNPDGPHKARLARMVPLIAKLVDDDKV